MAADASTRAVWLALFGNAFLTVAKFGAFALSGSGAMFSEAVHSLADTGNQALLAIGIHRSRRPADALFPYGFGGERYLFALLSAVGIFVLGCGVTMYHGVELLLNPAELHLEWYVFAVLGMSFFVEGWVLLQALRAIHAKRGRRPFLEYLRDSTDPTVAAVLLEDGVATVGVIIALVASGLTRWSGSPLPDALATLTIGAMMGGIAIWLGLKNRSLIVGRAIPASLQERVVAYLESQPTVARVRNVRSRVVGAEVFRFAAEIEWSGRALAEPLVAWVEERAAADGLDTPEGRAELTRALGERLTEALGDEVDRIEHELRERFPQLQYLDIESD